MQVLRQGGALRPFPPHSLVHLLQSAFPRVPAAATTPSEGPPAKVSGQKGGTVGHQAIQSFPIILWGPIRPCLGWCWCWFSDMASRMRRCTGCWEGRGLTAHPSSQPGSHALRLRSFPSPTKCLRCTSLMLGLGRQGLGCDSKDPSPSGSPSHRSPPHPV